MEQQDIELQIWAYIDGDCSGEAKNQVAKLIATDTVWASTYQQLLTLHHTLPQHAATDQPSMRFNKNVMDEVARTAISRPTRRYVNPVIIKGISAFFVLSFIAILGYALFTADGKTNIIRLPELDFARVFNSTLFHTIAWINVVLGLLLLDMFLRRKKMSSSSSKQA